MFTYRQPVWESYPPDYRSREIKAILTSVMAGECVSVVGLSGAGKSNLMGFLAHRVGPGATKVSLAQSCRFILVDCNRLPEANLQALLHLARQALGDDGPVSDEYQAMDTAIERCLAQPPGNLCLLLDRFDSLMSGSNPSAPREIAGNLRALRDAHKYSFTFVIATRQPLDPHTELAELFFANTLWLGPLSESDARWNIARYARRKGLQWDEEAIRSLMTVSWRYPSLLRATCEAAADGCGLSTAEMLAHPAVVQRVEEFWADKPGEKQLRLSGLEGQPLLMAMKPAWEHPYQAEGPAIDHSHLTAKEHLLLKTLQDYPAQVCEKDDLIRAVWPEDCIFEHGVRDDSLAQLVRRVREKIEPDPSSPRYIHTVPGRGYRFMP